MIVVDTNVWSETLRPAPDPRVLAWLRANAAELHLPALVVHEPRYGLAILPDGRRRADLTERVEAMLSRLAGRVLPYDADVAATHAHLRADARARGREPSAQDGQIAAHAVHASAPLATRNVGDFENLGIDVLNPWD
ncbi:PIN domain-containing protein [Cellulomonas septica]|uniref:Ribonuclease VapC n=1 Tax=Cellulomonas septica TaxID=285080 RepID=A0ABX1K508_9CELL|nr:type II toxin-antitoxin system VapC family toxin [Cellulomonas septica]